MKKLKLASILAGILIMAVAASSVSAFATTPEIVGQENITKALESAAKPIEGKIIRVDIPDGKGGYTTLEGEAAQKHYEEAVEQTQKALLDDLTVSSLSSQAKVQSGSRRGPFHYQYRYVETQHTNDVSRTDLRRNVSNKLTNESSADQTYTLELSVSQSWTINPEVSGELLNAVKLKLGGSWGKTYSKRDTFTVNIKPWKSVQIQFVPIMDKSVGNAQKYYIPRNSIFNKPVIEQNVPVTTYNPKYLTQQVGSKTIQTVYGEYYWVESY